MFLEPFLEFFIKQLNVIGNGVVIDPVVFKRN
jgi:hypothetical protein